MNRKHQLVEELSIIQTLDLSRGREGHLGKCKIMGICLGVRKTKVNPNSRLGAGAKIIRTFEILWLDTQVKSAHVQFEALRSWLRALYDIIDGFRLLESENKSA